ncbi:MAG TPA: cupin domain-containing protein [Gammaproteobacteria bacterium]|nr:cupin domain-containing protein [Gammaproteobacteria bacterium]
MNANRLCIVAAALVALSGVHAQERGAQQAGAAAAPKPLLTKPLAGIEGKEGLMLTVDIPPGGDSPPHRHNANTFVYVLEGSVVMQVAGQPAVTVSKGQTFYESPTDVHTVSRNASKTEPARILVFMVKDQGAPVTVPAAAPQQ